MEVSDKDLDSICSKLKINKDVLRGKKCPYCKNDTEYVDSSVIYGKSYGNIYLCQPCDAYVGVHHKTSLESLGSVANRKLREWRKKAHQAFDPIAFSKVKHPFKDGLWSRVEAYSWLSNKMDLPKPICHIGMFSVNKCKQVIEICKTPPWNE